MLYNLPLWALCKLICSFRLMVDQQVPGRVQIFHFGSIQRQAQQAQDVSIFHFREESVDGCKLAKSLVIPCCPFKRHLNRSLYKNSLLVLMSCLEQVISSGAVLNCISSETEQESS